MQDQPNETRLRLHDAQLELKNCTWSIAARTLIYHTLNHHLYTTTRAMAKVKQQSVLSFFKKTPVKESKKKETVTKSTTGDNTLVDEKTSPATPVTPETVTKSTLKSFEATTISSKPPPKFDTTGNVPTPSSEFEDGEDHSSPVKRVSMENGSDWPKVRSGQRHVGDYESYVTMCRELSSDSVYCTRVVTCSL